jgi:hypothetical protein
LAIGIGVGVRIGVGVGTLGQAAGNTWLGKRFGEPFDSAFVRLGRHAEPNATTLLGQNPSGGAFDGTFGGFRANTSFPAVMCCRELEP